MQYDDPPRIAIDHDDYHAEYVGRAGDGRQFFLTTPFQWAMGDAPDCEYIALFLFDDDGALVEHTIDTLGPRHEVDRAHARSLIEQRLASLGDVQYGRIVVRPFSVEHGGTLFGLIPRLSEDGAVEAVELLPGNYMAFFEPWDSGIYDT